MFTQNEPLTDAELERLADFLKDCKGGKAMNVEALDGFFAALIAGPATVIPSEYYREVFGARCRTPASSAASTKPMKFSD
jgi:yecA family protein